MIGVTLSQNAVNVMNDYGVFPLILFEGLNVDSK